MTIDYSLSKGNYKVVINHVEQYSIWPTERENELGWKGYCAGSVKVHWVSGDHSTMLMEPHIGILVKYLGDFLKLACNGIHKKEIGES